MNYATEFIDLTIMMTDGLWKILNRYWVRVSLPTNSILIAVFMIGLGVSTIKLMYTSVVNYYVGKEQRLNLLSPLPIILSIGMMNILFFHPGKKAVLNDMNFKYKGIIEPRNLPIILGAKMLSANLELNDIKKIVCDWREAL